MKAGKHDRDFLFGRQATELRGQVRSQVHLGNEGAFLLHTFLNSDNSVIPSKREN